MQVRLRHVTSLNPVSKQQTLKTAIQDLKHVKSIDSLLSAGAECLCLYLQCKLMIVQAQQDKMWTVPAALCTHQSSGLKSLVENILSTSYLIEFLLRNKSSAKFCNKKDRFNCCHAIYAIYLSYNIHKIHNSSSAGVKSQIHTMRNTHLNYQE